MAVSKSGVRRHSGRMITTALIAWACVSSGGTSLVWALAGDATGSSLSSVSIVTENELTLSSNPRSCLTVLATKCAQGQHLPPTCLEKAVSCTSLPEACRTCVNSKGGLATLTLRDPVGTYQLSPDGGRTSAAVLAQVMRGAPLALIQSYTKNQQFPPQLISERSVVPKELALNKLAETVRAVGFDADKVSPPGGFVFVKVTVDQTAAAAFDEQLALAPSLVAVASAGPLGCEPGEEDAIVRVTFTQIDSAAVARGVWRGACDADDRWATMARSGADDDRCSRGARPLLPTLPSPFVAMFAAGPAEACAVAEYRAGGRVIRTEQWCSGVELVVE